MLLLYYTSITVPVFTVLIAMTLSYVGLALSPFAALVSRRMAQDRGMPPNRYTIAGALYSSLALFPWFYLIAYQYGKPVPNSIVRLCYVFLYAVWLVGPIMGLGVLLMFEIDTPRSQSHIVAVHIGAVVLMIIAWTISLTKLLVVDYVSSKRHSVFNWNYLLPVVFFVASIWAYNYLTDLGNPLVLLTEFK